MERFIFKYRLWNYPADPGCLLGISKQLGKSRAKGTSIFLFSPSVNYMQKEKQNTKGQLTQLRLCENLLEVIKELACSRLTELLPSPYVRNFKKFKSVFQEDIC